MNMNESDPRVTVALEALVSLDVPTSAGAPKCRAALRAAGHRFENAVIAVAVRSRKRGSTALAVRPLALPTTAVSDRACIRCSTIYPADLVEFAFRAADRSGIMHPARIVRNVCRPCELTHSDEVKRADRWATKARDTIRRHAERFSIDKRDLIQAYGWEPELLARDAEFHYGGDCGYCHKSFKGMPNGLSDITLDIQDRDKPPHYRTNTKWCCQTCNRGKGSKTIEQFEAERLVWKLWDEFKKSAAEVRGMLF
jgi:hypothetical protein